MILQAAHTHLYPGHRGRISGLAQPADLRAGDECLVEFADGSAAPGMISQSGDDWLLQTESYRTAAGTDIAAKQWLFRVEQTAGQVKFRILEKLSSPQ